MPESKGRFKSKMHRDHWLILPLKGQWDYVIKDQVNHMQLLLLSHEPMRLEQLILFGAISLANPIMPYLPEPYSSIPNNLDSDSVLLF